MKTWISLLLLCSAISVFTVSLPLYAIETMKLPYGVDEVLKLSKANVSDDIIVKYVQNSGTIYQLGAQDIVYLRGQGVTDRVISAMLDQKTTANLASNQNTAPVAPQPPVDNNPPAYAPSYTQQPAPETAQPAPSTV